MKFNIAYPPAGTNKPIEFDDQAKLNSIYGKRISNELDGALFGDDFSGYIFKITGGNDKQGFPMKQGVLKDERTRLLLAAGHSCYRARRKGERKRRSVRGCIVGPDIAVLSLVVLKKGDAEIPGLTDKSIPNRLGPKRSSKIRKLFSLDKEDDVRDYVISRVVERNGKKEWKRPKIQRLVTKQRVRRKAKWVKTKKERIARKKRMMESYKQKKSEKKARD